MGPAGGDDHVSTMKDGQRQCLSDRGYEGQAQRGTNSGDLSHVLRWEPKVRGQQVGPGGPPPRDSPHGVLGGRAKPESSLGPFSKGTNPIREGPTPKTRSHQRPTSQHHHFEGQDGNMMILRSGCLHLILSKAPPFFLEPQKKQIFSINCALMESIVFLLGSVH